MPIIAALFAVMLTAATAFAASEFEGTWKVQDTKGNPFEITLNADGTAKGTREGEGLAGKWTSNEKRATITWDSGWTTKIVKKGDKYIKKAFEKGGEKAAHKSDAVKVN